MNLFKYTAFILISLISVYAPYVAYLNHSPNTVIKNIDIEIGESISQVAFLLSDHNFLDKLFLRYFIFSNKIDSFKAGEYSIRNKSMKEIFVDFSSGNTVTHKLVIKEGTNIYELNEVINQSQLNNDCIMLSCIQSDFGYLEGILYPDTYFYKKGMKASSILNLSYNRLKSSLDEMHSSYLKNNNLNNSEILILASIVEKEAGNDQEKDLIAGVFLNRLNLNMRLQADPTIIYGLLPNFDGDIKKSDILDKNNKYNTYMINGLPPSPIAVSSLSSIKSVYEGVASDYLFFVADSKTSHYFSKTYKEHLNKIKELGLDK